MNISKTPRVAVAVAAVFALSACGTYSTIARTKTDVVVASVRADEGVNRLAASIALPSDHEVNRPYVAGKSVPLSREVTLPHSLRRGVKTEVVFRGASKTDLTMAAQMLSIAIGVPIRVRPDALLPASSFGPRGGAVGGVTQVAQPGDAAGAAGSINMPVGEVAAAEVLDSITAQTGTYWKLTNEGVDIYRLVTRAFEIHAQQGKASVATGLGRSGVQGGSFESTSQTRVEQANMEPLLEIKATVEGMLTRGGAVVVGANSMVVTDTQESMDRIVPFIEAQNKALTRRIRLMFEAIEVTSRDNNEIGLNWDIVFNRLARMPGGNLVNTLTGQQSPVPLTSAQAGQASFAVSGNSMFSGSQLMLKALSDVGSVVNHTRVPMMTMNRRPVQYAVRTNFDYVSSIQVNTVASSAGTTTAPAITQKEETVGTVLTVTPSAFNDGQIIMNLAYDNTTLRSLEPYSAGGAGGGAATSTVQQRTIDGSGTVQSVSIRSGQTLVISGIEKIANQFDERRLDKSAPLLLGGSNRNKSTRTTTVLLVTAYSEDGI
ncbi:MAG: hypothetical protein CTY39_12380 [Hyphomicrobium sp.]|nr:MAG: hypothetical protein CTY39_12380 [Hyphomicrobium sp.]